MKYLIFQSLFLLILFGWVKISAQVYPADQGNFIISGNVNIASGGIKLYEKNDKTGSATILYSPSVDYFLKSNLFVGSALIFSHKNTTSGKENTYGIGPEIGYVFGRRDRKIMPVISAGYLFSCKKLESGYDPYNPYQYEESPYGGYGGGYGAYSGYNPYGYPTEGSFYGKELFLSMGVLIPIYKHLGVTVGGIFRYQNYIVSGIRSSGNSIALCLGVNGLLSGSKVKRVITKK